MSNMPDNVNTKKEVDDYYKDAMKKSMEKTKAANDNKPKKELNGYQKFMKENIKPLKESNPKLTGREVFSTIAMMWKKQNEANASATVASSASAAAATVVPVEEEDIEVSVNDTTEEVAEAKEEVAEAKEVKDTKDAPSSDSKTACNN